jgi:hypothetical protein
MGIGHESQSYAGGSRLPVWLAADSGASQKLGALARETNFNR